MDTLRDLAVNIGFKLRRLYERPYKPQYNWRSGQKCQAPHQYGETPKKDMSPSEWAAFQTLIRDIHETDKQHQAAEKDLGIAQLRTAKCLNRITAIGAIVGLVGSLGVIGSIIIAKRSADDAREATITANRAWISPVTAYIGWPSVGQPIHYQVVYENTGRSPALGLNWAFDNGYFATPPDGDGRKVQIPENNTCLNLLPTEGGAASFPYSGRQTPGALANSFSGQSDTVKHKIIADQDFLTDKHRFFVQGCVAYSTMGRIGHTQFCVFYIPTRKDGVLNFDVDGCPGGWDAD